jgi:hypothetical protein
VFGGKLGHNVELVLKQTRCQSFDGQLSNVILPNAIKPDMSKTRSIASRNNVFSNPDYLTFEHYNCFDGI